MSILTVGTMAFDSIETPYGKVDHVIGGACTYISWAASYWHSHINLVSIIGDDFPEDEIVALNKRGVKTDGLVRVQGKKSFYWSGRYHADMNGRDTLITDLNVLEDFSPNLPKDFQSSQFIMLGNLTPSIQASILDQLSDPPKLVILDTMNFWMDVAMDELKQLLFRVEPKYLVIKKGEHGALLFYEDQIFFAPGLPVADVLDPTGAGDSFAGGMIGYLAQTDDISFSNMKTAIIYGSVMASFCVEGFSLSKLKNLTQNEIYARIHQFENLSTFDVKELTVLNS